MMEEEAEAVEGKAPLNENRQETPKEATVR